MNKGILRLKLAAFRIYKYFQVYSRRKKEETLEYRIDQKFILKGLAMCTRGTHAQNSEMMLKGKHYFKYGDLITCKTTSYYTILCKIMKSKRMRI